MAGIPDLLTDLESVSGVEQANVVSDRSEKGTTVHITLTEDSEGSAGEVLDDVLNAVPRGMLPDKYDPEERVDVHYDAIDLHL